MIICNMDSVQLTRILSSNPYTRKPFYGVFPCDMLPREKLLQRPVCLVINTHPHNLPGEHWLAIYLTEENTGEFFDSYGHPPDHPLFPKTIVKFLRKNASKTMFQPRAVQASDSVVCGYHCVFFLQHRCKGLTFKTIQELYSHDLQRNDEMVVEHVKTKRNMPRIVSYMPRIVPNMFQPAQGCITCNAFHKRSCQ